MSRVFLWVLLLFSLSFAQDCELFFEAKKAEMAVRTQELDEARQNLQSFKAAFLALQKQKEEALNKKQADINATLAKIEKIKAENAEILRKTQEHLSTINKKTTGKLTEIYSQMKAKVVAAILSDMDEDDATKMLLSLKPRAVAGIISKMDPKKAAQLSLLLKKMDLDKKKLEASKDANKTK